MTKFDNDKSNSNPFALPVSSKKAGFCGTIQTSERQKALWNGFLHTLKDKDLIGKTILLVPQVHLENMTEADLDYLKDTFFAGTPGKPARPFVKCVATVISDPHGLLVELNKEFVEALSKLGFCRNHLSPLTEEPEDSPVEHFMTCMAGQILEGIHKDIYDIAFTGSVSRAKGPGYLQSLSVATAAAQKAAARRRDEKNQRKKQREKDAEQLKNLKTFCDILAHAEDPLAAITQHYSPDDLRSMANVIKLFL